MSLKIEWCEYFAAIEHCEGCFQRTERVLAKARPTKQINWEKN